MPALVKSRVSWDFFYHEIYFFLRKTLCHQVVYRKFETFHWIRITNLAKIRQQKERLNFGFFRCRDKDSNR
ncbi:MAG: hypothetical protein DRH12_11600 [Deltaproteobacteria bacterium]|nr:MAG: hypothetical protein DRH12_11600 [Deltaproteobacteria bacterium]